MNDSPAGKMAGVYARLGLDIPKIAVLVVTLFYGCGYLVQAITLRNFGIHRLETVKLQYIEVGVTFAVLLLLVTVVPYGCVLAHLRIRKRSGLPHYVFGATVYLLNTYHLFLTVMFFALFITSREWTATVLYTRSLPGGLQLQHALAAYGIPALFVLCILPLIERAVCKRGHHVKIVYALAIEPIRLCSVLLAGIFDVLLIRSFHWIESLIIGGLLFAGTALVLAAAIYAIIYYMSKLGDERSMHLLAALGTTGAFVVLYMCINAYVYGVVRHIPTNRGGKLPVTSAYVYTKGEIPGGFPIPGGIMGTWTEIGPVYVIEETEDYLYVARECGEEWFGEWSSTYALKKDLVEFMFSDRKTHRGPR